MKLGFFGGTEEVTGSRHVLANGAARVLLDCGLFQGHRRESIEKNRTLPFDSRSLNAVLLSHAHIDHSGGLPLLVKSGFSKPIHCTAPTADLCRVMLMDSAHLQEEDAKFFNKIHAADGERIDPLYNQDDVEKTLRLFVPHAYDEFFDVADGMRARFLNAGHVLGSAMIQIEMDTAKGKRRLLFTGDLGRRQSILMTPPEVPDQVDVLVIESTYGGRRHDPVNTVEKAFADIITKAAAEAGRILIPSFALERTQEIVFVLEKLRREKRIPPIHLYVDSPMAADITKIFTEHLDCVCLSPKFKRYVATKGDPFGLDTVRYIRSVEESKQLNELPGRKIILSASGMCEGGRILHHLRNNIAKENTTVLLVGYQASGTLGRRLADGAKKVKIFGLQHDVRAHVEMMHHFSAHADQDDLLWFVTHLNPRPRRIFVVHGDRPQQEAFLAVLNQAGINNVECPTYGQEFDFT